MSPIFKYETNLNSAKNSTVAESKSTYGVGDLAINDIQEPITSAAPEVREIIERVVQAEKEKLYLKNPRNINDDILKIVKEAVQ